MDSSLDLNANIIEGLNIYIHYKKYKIRVDGEKELSSGTLPVHIF